jgi:hypothetical protein
MRDSTMSRKKHDTTPVAEAAELAHELVDSTPPSETKADWIETVLDEQSPHWNAFSPAMGNKVCERIANGESLLKITRDPGMPSRSTVHRWCANNPDFRREYEIACQLRTDGYLEETIDIIDDKKEMVTETTSENEDGTKSVSKAFSKEAVAYALARINIRYSTIGKMLPRKWGKEGHGLGEPAPEPPRDGSTAKNMGNVVVLDQHPLKAQIDAWQRLADEAKKKT